jgi:hypothetical protein
VRLLLDEQISGKVADRLRDRGHDVAAATADPGLRGLSDPDLFGVAQQQGRAMVTYNRPDFEAIVREYAETDREHHGLVIVHPTRSRAGSLRGWRLRSWVSLSVPTRAEAS